MPDHSSPQDHGSLRQDLPHQWQLANQQCDSLEQLFRDLDITADLARGHREPAPSNRNRHRAHVKRENKGRKETPVSNSVQGSRSRGSETQRSYADVARGPHINKIQSSRLNTGRFPLSNEARTPHLNTTTAPASSDPQTPQGLLARIPATTVLRQDKNPPRISRRNAISAASGIPANYHAPPVHVYGIRNHHSNRHPSQTVVNPESEMSLSKDLHNLIIRHDSKAPVSHPACSIQAPYNPATSRPASALSTDPYRTPRETLNANRISTTQRPGVRATLLTQEFPLSPPVRPTSLILDRALGLRRAEMDSFTGNTPESSSHALITIPCSSPQMNTGGSIERNAGKGQDGNGVGIAVEDQEDQEEQEEEEQDEEECEVEEEGFEIIETWDRHLSDNNEAIGRWYKLWRL